MQDLATQIREYRKYHTKQATQITHYVGVPLIIFASLIFLGWIHITIPSIVSTHLGWLVSIALVGYYFFYNWMLALFIAVDLIILNLIANFISQPEPSLFGLIFFLICFIGGWAAQFIGHYLEGNKPAFMDYTSAIISAPICLAAEALFRFGLLEDLKKQVESGKSE